MALYAPTDARSFGKSYTETVRIGSAVRLAFTIGGAAVRNHHNRRLRILIVEDEAVIAADLVETITEFGGDVVDICPSAGQALRMVEIYDPDIVLMDICLGDGDGIEIGRLIRQAHAAGIVFVSGNTDPGTMHRVTDFGSAPFVPKPVDGEMLQRAIHMAVERPTMREHRPTPV